MLEIANNVYQIPLFPRNGINVYLLGSTLVDAGIRSSGKRILKEIGDRNVSTHVLTHAHADHQGASAFICNQLNIPLWCGKAEKEAAETGEVTNAFSNPNHPIAKIQQRFWSGLGHPVAKTLQEGDMVEDFVVLETPGHSPGHIVFWRESDGVLIAGDVVVNMNLMTTITGVGEPPALFTADIATNRQSIKKIAALKPRITCVGHGPPLYDTEALINLANQW